ncbi:MAG: ArnT family glycosyltransferase [Anaerolineae bacterium]
MSDTPRPDDDAPGWDSRRREPAVTHGERVALALLVLVAAVIRGYRLADWPPGLHVDEAFNLLDARAMIQSGWWPVFLPANAGRDVLYSYLQAPLLRLLGESVANVRLASAMIGTLSIPLFWLTARRLLGSDPGIPPERLRRLAFLAAGFAGLSLWHLHFSRFGIRAVLFPPVVCVVVLAWWEVAGVFLGAASESRPTPPTRFPKVPLITLSISLGLAFYTHPAGRALVALPACHALYLAWKRRDVHPLRLVVQAFAGALLIAAPLLYFWWRHPETFGSHAGEVSILRQGWQALWDNTRKVAGMFTVDGDSKPWRNLVGAGGRGRPVFGPALGGPSGDFFFTLLLPLTGLVTWLSALRRERPWAVMAAFWLLILLLPSMTTDQAPNFSRSIGALPPAFLLLACGLEWFPGGLRGRLVLRPQDRTEALFWNLAAALFLGLFGYQTWQDYRSWMSDPNTPLAFDDDKAALANYVNAERAAGNEVYLTAAMAAHPTVQSLVRERARGFDARYGWVLPPAGVGRASYVGLDAEDRTLYETQCNFFELSQYTLLPTAVPGGGQWNRRQPADRTIHAAAAHQLRGCRVEQIQPWLDDRPLDSTAGDGFGGSIRLVAIGFYTHDSVDFFSRQDLLSAGGVRDLPPGLRAPQDGLDVNLVWQAISSPPANLNVAIQLVNAQGRGIAQADGPPVGPVGGASSYPSEIWRPGETVITRHQLAIPADAPAGTATLRVGLYDWRTGTPLLSADGQSVLPVARIPIGPP